MIRFLFVLILVVTGASVLRSQILQVYPGDANNNGVVNNVDFLFLGLAYNSFGPERDPVAPNGLAFLPQPATPWPSQFFNGVNFAHADCNGDGIVHYFYDAFPLYVNYGQMRPDSVTADVFPPGLAGVDPAVHFDHSALPNSLSGGQTFSLPIMLGDAQHPVEDLYGIAFSVFLDPDYVDADDVDFNFNELSWANPDNDRIFMYKKVSNERIDVAWVRTDHNQRDGYGRIGIADFIIIIDVIGYQQDFVMRIDSVKMIDKFGNQTAVAGDTIVVHLSPDGQATDVDSAHEKDFIARPNPADRHLTVKHEDIIEQITLVNALGQPVFQVKPKQNSANLDLPFLPSGIYLLEIRTTEGINLQTLQIQH